jgi:hypothetical protein
LSASQDQPRSRRRRVLRGLGGLVILVAIVAGATLLKQGDEPETAQASESATADSAGTDSTAVALEDSAATDSTAAQPKKKKRGGLFAFLGGGSEEEPEEEEEPAVPVEMADVSRRDVPSYFTGTATVEARQEAQVLAKIAMLKRPRACRSCACAP